MLKADASGGRESFCRREGLYAAIQMLRIL
jgi:hypothetical protein